MTVEFPRHYLVALQEVAARVIESRHLEIDFETLARDLLTGFYDLCLRSGLDNVLAALEESFHPVDLSDRFALAEHPQIRAALVEKLGQKQSFDVGGPRNAKPRQLAECVVASLSLTIVDEPDRTISLGDDIRKQVSAALTSVLDVELAAPQMRAAIIAKGRALCDARYHDAFDKIVAQLDERGMRMLRQPKLPLDAVQAVQRVLADARQAVIERAAKTAIDRAKQALARANPEAAARIDDPIRFRLSPRDVAILRVGEARFTAAPATVFQSLFESLTELAHLAWRPLEKPVRQYAANQTFAVGDVLEHPKFGRGTVKSCDAQRIQVEFADGPRALVHVKATK